MATLSRPSWGDPGREKYTLGELQDAQNLYDLTKAQEKQNELLAEQNRMAQQQMQQQMQLQQQEMQFREEQERQRRIAEENAEMDKALNQARVYCQSKGVDFDYMLNFYARCYSEKEKTPEIIQIENDIDMYKLYKNTIHLKEEFKPIQKKYNKMMYIKLSIILAIVALEIFIFITFFINSISAEVFVGIFMGTTIIGTIISFSNIGLEKGYMKMMTDKQRELNNLQMEYSLPKNETIETCDTKINELQTKLEKQIEELNIDTRKHQKEFDDFRKNHYNKEIELLFKDLSISFNKISKDEIKKEGTIADYKEFFEDKMLEL